MIRRKIPISFQGNKSKHIDDFINYIKQCPCQTYVDLFGGSCYLSYVVHQLKPQARVVCNDYDNYRERLINIDTTNQIIDSIKAITKTKHNTKYSPETTQQIKDIINEFKAKGKFIDSITLSSCLCFSGTYYTTSEKLLEQPYFYNKLSKQNHESVMEIEISSLSFIQKLIWNI